jgi:hypothetical protein
MKEKVTQYHIEQFAKYMAKKYGGKFTITPGSIEMDPNGSIDSWDLDYNGVEYDGGSYIIKDGSIINTANGNKKEASISQFKSNNKFENKTTNLKQLIERIVDRKLNEGNHY